MAAERNHDYELKLKIFHTFLSHCAAARWR